MEREEIINKLIENGIIENESDINEELEEFVSLRRYYNIDDILQSGLLEKYDLKIINECIRLKPSGKLRDTPIDYIMPVEEMDVYCQIKQANPDLDITENDRYLYSLKREYIEKYGAEDLGFIIGKIDILSHTFNDGWSGSSWSHSNERRKSNIDDNFRYNFTKEQLDKIKRIAKQYPDFKFEIYDEIFELEEFWNLDDETFKDILTAGKYYKTDFQQEYLKDIITTGNLDKWLEIKKSNDFLPRSAIYFNQKVLERFNFR